MPPTMTAAVAAVIATQSHRRNVEMEMEMDHLRLIGDSETSRAPSRQTATVEWSFFTHAMLSRAENK